MGNDPKTVKRILIVDDCEEDRVICKRMLGTVGMGDCEFVWADVGEVGLELCQSQQFNCVLLDYNLPDMTGLGFIESLAEEDGHLSVPIVMLSGVGNEVIAVEAMKHGVSDFLKKNQMSPLLLLRSIQVAIQEKHLERLEREERQRLRTATQAMERVLGVIAHELRTPLAAMRVTAELLLDANSVHLPDTQKLLKMFNREAVRMADMTNNLLDAARLDHGCAKWNWSSVPIESVCEGVLYVVRCLVDINRVSLCADVDPPDLMMNGDPDAVRRLLINLITNGVKHTEDGSITVSAREAIHDGERFVVIKVTDTGEGVSPVAMGRLGQAFALNSSLIGADYTSGSGLGLSICKAIVAAHGGEMSVASKLGQGSCFTVRMLADMAGPRAGCGDAEISTEAAA